MHDDYQYKAEHDEILYENINNIDFTVITVGMQRLPFLKNDVYGVPTPMKQKLKPFDQHLYHEIEDEVKAGEYLDKALPLIGLIVFYFNSLESSLDAVLCENFTDRTDSTGLIVLHKMNYSTKVELLKRFCDDFHIGMRCTIEGYEALMTKLNECGRLRNLVVHADWQNTDEEGYTFVKLKMSKQGMQQEYIQFTEESLDKIIDLLLETKSDLFGFWELREAILNDKT